MAFRIARLPRNVAIADKNGSPTQEFQRWWQRVAEGIEAEFGALEAAAAAEAAATAAQTAADNAQAAADAAQDAVDAIEVPPSGTRTVTTSDNILTSDFTILADASGGAITLTLPSANGVYSTFIVKKTDATANAVNIDPAGSDTLNGLGVPIAITTSYEQRTIASDGVDAWYLS